MRVELIAVLVRRIRLTALVALLMVAVMSPVSAAVTDPTSTVDGLQSEHGDRTIEYVATLRDRPNLDGLGFGDAGQWFPQFAAAGSAEARPTNENVRDELPTWVAAFNHTEHPGDPGCTEDGALTRGCTPSYNFRTFSQDGPARSWGGFAHWAQLRLPGGECGTAGSIVDPHTFVADQEYPDPTGVFFPPEGTARPNNNNTMNRIQLQDGVPAEFYVGVLTDATGGDFDPGRLEIRGNVGIIDQREEVAETQIESATAPSSSDLFGNGVPDVHVFKVSGFRSGDYLKLRIAGKASPGSFSGLLFDESFDGAPRRPTLAGGPHWCSGAPRR